MALLPLNIINIGLAKIGQSRIKSYDTPRTDMERTAAESYPQWRDNEIAKRRWVFATRHITLSRTDTPKIENTRYAYEYNKPADCLRIVRDRRSKWQLRGSLVYSEYPTQDVEAIMRVPEAEFDAAFIEVLAARAAKELVEPATQSNEKWQKAQTVYKDAINDAARLNAFSLEDQSITPDDEDSSWTAARSDPWAI